MHPSQIDIEKTLDNETIAKFIDDLNINEEEKNKLKESLPSFTDEEKVFLWKTLLDIWQLDREEERSIKMLKDYWNFTKEEKTEESQEEK